MRIWLLSSLLLTQAAWAEPKPLGAGNYPKARPKVEVQELEKQGGGQGAPGGRGVLIPAAQRPRVQPNRVAQSAPVPPPEPLCGQVLRAAHSRAWVVSTPGQSLIEGTIVEIERAGRVLGEGKIVQAGNGVAMLSSDQVPVVAGDEIRVKWLPQAPPTPVLSRTNLPSSQDPTYQEWLRRPSSVGVGFTNSGFGYGYGYNGYGFNNSPYFDDYNYNYNNNFNCQPCHNPAPCPPPPPPDPNEGRTPLMVPIGR